MAHRRRTQPARRWCFRAVHVAGMLALRKLAYAVVGQHYAFDSLAAQAFYELQKDLITYALILVVIFANREFQVRRTSDLRAAELAAELGQARLKHLTAQIEPHFLFNTLNAISNRMHEDVEAADRMISSLGALMRAAYDSDNQVLVPLERELDWLRGYAAMMTERFRGQLSFDLTVAAGTRSGGGPASAAAALGRKRPAARSPFRTRKSDGRCLAAGNNVALYRQR